MQRVSTTLFCFLAVLLVAATGASVMGVEKQFALFKKRYNRKYTSAADEQRALEAFKANLATIRRLRKLNPGARFGITKFADMTPEEFRRGRRSVVPKVGANRARAVAPKNSSIPQTLNWITRGAVTPVQNQGECGSDWAFSTVANIEGVNFVKNNRLTALSVEELLDCDTASNGCDGGFMANAYEFLLQKQGGNIMTAASWPYTSGASNCSYVNKTVGATITGYVQIAEDEDTIRSYTATYGPVAVAVDAESWQFYQSGVLVNCTFSELTSGVAIVGYNDATTTPYWIVKNSWGADWGMNGYIYVQKGVNACGIKNYALTAFAAKY